MGDVVTRKLPKQPTLVVRGTQPVAGIPEFLGSAYHQAAVHAAAREVDIVGPPFARYRSLDGENSRFEIEAGFPVDREAEGSGTVELSSLPAGDAATLIHVGPYEAMEPAYAELWAWIDTEGGTPDGPAWEVYYSDPAEEPDPATWRTKIVQPYRS